MVQNKKTVGRPIEFNPDETLEKIMLLFWQRGYENVSFTDIEKTSGLNKPSLFNYFGSKQELFQKSLKLYHQKMTNQASSLLTKGRGLADLEDFFKFLGDHVQSSLGPYGCFMVNSMVDFADNNTKVLSLTTSYRKTMKEHLVFALRSEKKKGRIVEEDIQLKAEFLIAVLLGINVSARAGVPIKQLKGMIESIRIQIQYWKEN